MTFIFDISNQIPRHRNINNSTIEEHNMMVLIFLCFVSFLNINSDKEVKLPFLKGPSIHI